MNNNLKTLEDCELGDILYDVVDPRSGLRGLVLRGPFAFCAYVGAPREHLLDGVEDLSFDCHFGVTYTGWGDGFRPVDWFWWGWDYGHFTDMTTISDEMSDLLPPELKAQLGALFGDPRSLKRWSVGEIAAQVQEALDELASQLAAAKIYTHQILAPKVSS